MPRILALGASIALFLTIVSTTHNAIAQDGAKCIRDYIKKPAGPGEATSASIKELVFRIANSIALSSSGLTIIECSSIIKVSSLGIGPVEKPSENTLPPGDYILYEKTWVSEVIGSQIDPTKKRTYDEAIFVFGHELGHILGRHFTSNDKLPKLQKETDADRFGGCAAGVMGADWNNVEGILSRIRPSVDGEYPSREHSIAVAHESYSLCLRSKPIEVSASPSVPGKTDVLACVTPQDRPTGGTSPSRQQLTNSLIAMTFIGQKACIQTLVAAGADVSGYGNAGTFEGPALHEAITQKQWSLALMLLDAGANPNQFYSIPTWSMSGPVRALDMAFGMNAPQYVVEAIRKHGGN